MKAHPGKCIDAWFIPGWKMVFSCAEWITEPGTVCRLWCNMCFCWCRPSPRICSSSAHREGPAERCQTDRPRHARIGPGVTWPVSAACSRARRCVSSPCWRRWVLPAWGRCEWSLGFGHICPTICCGCNMRLSWAVVISCSRMFAWRWIISIFHLYLLGLSVVFFLFIL